jgi:hypothetical protein
MRLIRRKMSENILELISKVDEFVGMSELFSDSDLDFALSMICKIITKPDIPASAAVTTIVQLEAIAAKLHVQASYLKNVEKPKPNTVEYHKKNLYLSVCDALRNLTAALKYTVKV